MVRVQYFDTRAAQLTSHYIARLGVEWLKGDGWLWIK